jgi:hypothetical protein
MAVPINTSQADCEVRVRPEHLRAQMGGVAGIDGGVIGKDAVVDDARTVGATL